MNAQRKAFMEEFDGFRVDVPQGISGLYMVTRHTMTKRDMMVSTALDIVCDTDRGTRPGTYTQLRRYGRNGNPYQFTVVMSDHVGEVADHAALLAYARANAPLAHVLINGLGLGVAIELLAPVVEHFTIVELCQDVIDLVGPHYQERYGDRLDIVHADALDYRPPTGVRYDAVFHDIWDHITARNLPQMHRLHRKYGRRCDWQESWARKYCEREARKQKRHPENFENAVSVDDVLESLYSVFDITGDE